MPPEREGGSFSGGGRRQGGSEGGGTLCTRDADNLVVIMCRTRKGDITASLLFHCRWRCIPKTYMRNYFPMVFKSRKSSLYAELRWKGGWETSILYLDHTVSVIASKYKLPDNETQVLLDTNMGRKWTWPNILSTCQSSTPFNGRKTTTRNSLFTDESV